MTEKLHETLKKYWGHDHFRPLQLETILSVVSGRDTLVLMPTGGGKSLVYQVPGMALDGVCIVVTPLIALMKDQVDRLKSRRILAEAIHSGVSPHDIDRILDNCVWGDTKFLYISPERIDSEMFRMRFSKMKISIIAVDEAHCISQWGYDFRPSYLRIERLRELQPEVPVLALTASATPEVTEDIMDKLRFAERNVMRMSFARANLSYIVRSTEDKNEQLLRIIGNVGGQGIVYVRTRERCQTVADILQNNGITAESYHGGMGYVTRGMKQDLWTKGRVRVIVATNAFGMGIDKADVRYVIHYDMCDSLEEYYQEAGRAGRDGLGAYAVMLVSSDDTGRSARRIGLDFPPLDNIKTIYEKLCSFLQIGIGESKGSSYTFNLYEFCKQAGLFAPYFVNAMKILQMNGYLILTEEMENPTRIMFIVPRDQLYRIRVNRKELDFFITVLLRRYTGIFSDYVPVREEELAQLSGYTPERINEMLKTLRQLHVIKYIPSNRNPRIFMTEERLPTKDLRISPESYKIRREVAEKRLGSIIEYAGSNICRSLAIQRYFGEEANEPCGRCDVCRKRKKSGPENISKQIEHLLRQEPMGTKELIGAIKRNDDEIIASINMLLETRCIAQREDGKLFLIS